MAKKPNYRHRWHKLPYVAKTSFRVCLVCWASKVERAAGPFYRSHLSISDYQRKRLPCQAQPVVVQLAANAIPASIPLFQAGAGK